MKSKLAFDHNMLTHINEARVAEGKQASALIELAGKALSHPLMYLPLGFIEKVLGSYSCVQKYTSSPIKQSTL